MKRKRKGKTLFINKTMDCFRIVLMKKKVNKIVSYFKIHYSKIN